MVVVHPEAVKAAIRMKYGSLAAFAAAHKLGAQAVGDLLCGKSSTGKPQVAKLLGIEADRLVISRDLHEGVPKAVPERPTFGFFDIEAARARRRTEQSRIVARQIAHCPYCSQEIVQAKRQAKLSLLSRGLALILRVSRGGRRKPVDHIIGGEDV